MHSNLHMMKHTEHCDLNLVVFRKIDAKLKVCDDARSGFPQFEKHALTSTENNLDLSVEKH